ncbi:LysR family transcriptional regulator, nitrogen assimilation regulatory protein [Devosia crocina]|uniref:LysR family transcriptional regulator, nitrogen assimilation regulatory protein n=1 Tax=Devosia crocina TaxID=429728 RepID=A0A1I7MZL6_9HYPH|nr:nitrogen assimilation transcriptional regulator NAC [Devosia crocina]SFV27851.1 LysR family transcriptional regulator, nitrogen assimilation regulatory protein [Devosia crocina]
MDTRRLHAFVKIIDIGSLTRAAAILHIAQPALSQQIVALETHFGKQLLVRSKRGVAPTEAGRMLYKHAQVMLRQLEQAETDIESTGSTISGRVSVGLAPLSTATSLALPLLQAVRERFPGIVLQINENIGGVISEMIMTGKMDVAFIYDPGEIRGVDFEPILTEDLFLVAPRTLLTETALAEGEISVEDVARLDLVLATRIHTVRQLVDLTFRRVGVETNVIAEIESVPTIARAIWAGLGATILPWSSANAILAGHDEVAVCRITKPSMQVKVSICTSDQLPLSEPAQVVSDLLGELAHKFAADHQERGVRAIPRQSRR